MPFIFWFSVAAILYTYLGYALGIWALAKLRTRRPASGTTVDAACTPSVSVVMACFNESEVIERRIANLAESDYPQELLEIVVVSDGSTDDTLELARAFSLTNSVITAGYRERQGKSAALNLGVALAAGQIVVFADARQSFEPEAIGNLVSAFADPTVGGASGELVLSGDCGSSVGEGTGLYWKYEEWIRKNESRFDSCIGATGAIYAIRRELWRELPPGTILDDVYTPMQIALAGHRVVFEEGAKAYDAPPEAARHEFRRKARTLLGNYQLCQLMPRLLLPWQRLAVQFYSHKLLRLAAPLFLLTLLVSNCAICASESGEAARLVYSTALAAQIGFYLSMLTGWALSRRRRKSRLFNSAYVFSLMNAAALVGLFYFLIGKRDVWVRGD